MNKIIAANLKMNLSYDEILNYKKIIEDSNKKVIICPSNIYLDIMKSDKYDIGSQDGYYKDSGAFTGEVSFKQLKSMNIKYSLIGHSERRHIFNEDNDLVALKLKSCIENNIIPILCVGETKEERDNHNEFKIVKEQIDSALSNIELNDILIAYEPVWSIGTGVIPSMEDIENMHKYIKEVSNAYKKDIKVLYGGSVKPDNIENICNIDVVDGVLIGGASLDPTNLVNMCNKIM